MRLRTVSRDARYGVAVWSAAALDALTVEMLCGLVEDLNTATRFSGLPLAPADNAVGVMQACAWVTGCRCASDLGGGFQSTIRGFSKVGASSPAAKRTACFGYRLTARSRRRGAMGSPTIALTGRDANFRCRPRVHIAVGRPGVDHAGVEHLRSIGSLALVEAKEPSDTISVADAIARIVAILPRVGEQAC